MRWARITVTVPSESAEAASAALLEGGSPGLTESGIEPVVLTGFLPEDSEFAGRIVAVQARLARLKDFGLSVPLNVVTDFVDEQDWAEAWKLYWTQKPIGNRLAIKPSWEPYTGDPSRLIIQLDPGMAFGTGAHPTTHLCLLALEQYVRAGDRVADIGTGSGILALAAARLGAERVYATDIDLLPRSIAKANVETNGLEAIVEVLEPAEFDQRVVGCDLVVANILASVIIELLPEIVKRLVQGGVFIGSGIVEERLNDVLQAADHHMLELIEVRSNEIWHAVVFRKAAASAGPGADPQ